MSGLVILPFVVLGGASFSSECLNLMTALDRYAITCSSLMLNFVFVAGWMGGYGSARLLLDIQFLTNLENNKFVLLLYWSLKTVSPVAILAINFARYIGMDMNGNDGCTDLLWVYSS